MKRCMVWRGAALLALAVAALAIAPAAVAEPSSRLQLAGSTTMAPLMEAIVQRFRERPPHWQIEVRRGGSGQGISEVRQGQAAIGMVSRQLAAGERDLYGVAIARDGVALIVHKDNPVTRLGERQLLDIYSGRITNWRQLGGRDAAMHVLAGSAEGGSSEQITGYLQLPYERLTAQRRIAANAERIAAVAADPDALIYVSLGEAERQARAGVPIKLLAIGGVAATGRNVRSGNYPLSRPLILVMRGPPSGAARAFVEYCLSSQVTDLIQSFDFVPYLD